MRLRATAVTIALALSTVAAAPAAATTAPLTNLAHLDFLGDTVSPPAQPGHTTYRLDAEPAVGVLWTYADRRDDGHYDRIGGGDHDPVTDTYTQGAFNADDVARASVVQDSLLLRPEVSQVVFADAALLQSAATGPRTGTVTLPGADRATVLSYDARGRPLDRETATGPEVTVPVAAGGFTLLRW